jgi:hypothetical protein
MKIKETSPKHPSKSRKKSAEKLQFYNFQFKLLPLSFVSENEKKGINQMKWNI